MKKAICSLLFILVLCFAIVTNAEEPQKVSIGDIITFGNYEQDNDLGNGPEPIEWIVLDVQEGKVLLLSRYCLDAMEYSNEYSPTTWETGLIRKWLNNDFINGAFSDQEQDAVLVTLVDNSAAQGQGYTVLTLAAQNDTEDRIFLLSYHEAYELYFQDNKSRICSPTPYAVARGAWDTAQFFNPDQHIGLWWLRSFDESMMFVTYVDFDGTVDAYSVADTCVCLRPAFWLELNSDI